MILDLIQKYLIKIEASTRGPRFLIQNADPKTRVIYGLSAALLLLLLAFIYVYANAPREGRHDPYTAVNLSSGPIIRTYEIGKVYKSQLLKAVGVNPDAMIGISARDLHVLFGNSDFIRYEGRSMLWQYKNDSCVLDIFFETREGKSQDMAPAAYYEIRPAASDSGEVDKPSCIRDLLNASAGPYMVGVRTFYKSVME